MTDMVLEQYLRILICGGEIWLATALIISATCPIRIDPEHLPKGYIQTLLNNIKAFLMFPLLVYEIKPNQASIFQKIGSAAIIILLILPVTGIVFYDLGILMG
jgi:hypothetical protein